MTCYTRHLKELLPEAPIAHDRRALDAAVRRVLELPESARCPEIWVAVKATDREDLEARVRRQL